MNSAGSGWHTQPTQVIDGVGIDLSHHLELRVNASEPAVSPDGSRLAFWVKFAEKSTGLMTLPANGGEPTQVKVGKFDAFTMAWSRDGRRILGAMEDICSVPVEGGEPVCLEINLHTIWSFDLHPDGKRLVFYDEVMRQDVWALKNVVAGANRSPSGPGIRYTVDEGFAMGARRTGAVAGDAGRPRFRGRPGHLVRQTAARVSP
ncbi:MAG: hypothetical protein AAB225_00955 [Acidobacteriota bacterium]